MGALALALLGYLVLNEAGGGNTAGANCVQDTLRVAVGPELRDLAAKAVDVVDDNEDCIQFEVYEATAKQVLRDLADDEAERIQLWIPETPAWRSEIATTGHVATELTPALARTPVGIASGPMRSNAPSWREALEGEVVLVDPLTDGGSALACSQLRPSAGRPA